MNLPSLLEEYGFEYFKKPILLDKLHYLIDLLLRRSFSARNQASFFPVKAEYLRAIVGQRYASLVKNALLTLGIIETNHSYRVGIRSIGYRLTHQFRVADVYRVGITDKKLSLRIKRQSKRRIAETVRGKGNLKAIARSLNMVTIDFRLADRYMRETVFCKRRSKQTRLNQLQAFREKDFSFSVDRQGRVHYNFVALSNDLKQFASINNEALFSVDVGNMQPALLSLFYETACEEKARYISLVSGNDFYAFFNRRMQCPANLEDEAEKKRFKRLLFKNYLFCRNFVKHEIKDIFQREFPILADAVQLIKKGFHQRLARRLQQIEASVVIGEVVKKLAEKYPLMPILSVHDCIVTTAPYVKLAEQMMEAQFNMLLGFAVPIKSKQITAGAVIASSQSLPGSPRRHQEIPTIQSHLPSARFALTSTRRTEDDQVFALPPSGIIPLWSDKAGVPVETARNEGCR